MLHPTQKTAHRFVLEANAYPSIKSCYCKYTTWNNYLKVDGRFSGSGRLAGGENWTCTVDVPEGFWGSWFFSWKRVDGNSEQFFCVCNRNKSGLEKEDLSENSFQVPNYSAITLVVSLFSDFHDLVHDRTVKTACVKGALSTLWRWAFPVIPIHWSCLELGHSYFPASHVETKRLHRQQKRRATRLPTAASLIGRWGFQSLGILGGRSFLIIAGGINVGRQSPSVCIFARLHDCLCLANCAAANESEQQRQR